MLAPPKSGVTAMCWTLFACILSMPSTCPIKTGLRANLIDSCFHQVELHCSRFLSQSSEIRNWFNLYFSYSKEWRRKDSELKNVKRSGSGSNLKIKVSPLKVKKTPLALYIFFKVWLYWSSSWGKGEKKSL